MEFPEKDEYKNVEDLLMEPSFCAYCIGNEEAAIHQWEDWLRQHPGKLALVKEAKRVYILLNGQNTRQQFEKDHSAFSAAVRQLIATAHETKISKISKVHKAAKVFSFNWKWAAAAAAVLMLVGYLLVSTQNTNKHIPSMAEGNQSEDILPGGNKAILTLADGTILVLDSANNGAITKQGSVTVIKLNDGLLSYEKASGKEAKVVYNTISTPRGGQYQLVLADGSKVWLNAASSIKFPNIFSGNDRRVELTGEGYFEVAHNEKKPFYVKVGDMEVKVLGTHFNVNAYGDNNAVKATLLEGKVKVDAAGQSEILVPGQQAKYEFAHQALRTINNVDVDHIVAWKDGYFSFDGDKIDEVMHKISRWYDVQVTFSGKKPEGHFSGIISRHTALSGVLYALEMNGVKYMLVGKNLIIK